MFDTPGFPPFESEDLPPLLVVHRRAYRRAIRAFIDGVPNLARILVDLFGILPDFGVPDRERALRETEGLLDKLLRTLYDDYESRQHDGSFRNAKSIAAALKAWDDEVARLDGEGELESFAEACTAWLDAKHAAAEAAGPDHTGPRDVGINEFMTFCIDGILKEEEEAAARAEAEEEGAAEEAGENED